MTYINKVELATTIPNSTDVPDEFRSLNKLVEIPADTFCADVNNGKLKENNHYGYILRANRTWELDYVIESDIMRDIRHMVYSPARYYDMKSIRMYHYVRRSRENFEKLDGCKTFYTDLDNRLKHLINRIILYLRMPKTAPGQSRTDIAAHAYAQELSKIIMNTGEGTSSLIKDNLLTQAEDAVQMEILMVALSVVK